MAWFDLASGRHSSLPQGFTSSGESRTLRIPRPGRVWGRVFCTQDPTGCPPRLLVVLVVGRVRWCVGVRVKCLLIRVYPYSTPNTCGPSLYQNDFRTIDLRKNCYGQVIVSPRILKRKAVLLLILQQKLGLFKSAAPN
ncbi:hypothetical protein NC653_011769 [Populus alba x Populus x berolinensis]|uniref:Uncharacterized protein n=1 Tax=Populus alba x Populus x berolinensis TaxID=444605 RepID=A0AAD6W8B4_9ROSI|nr:hypothetical protein NC653_011769 [Populus alba x Populus x berolinensis]